MKQHWIYRNSIVRFNKNAYKKMKNGKAFNLFLLDGEVTGRMKCTLPSWSGLAYKIPRTYLDTCKDRAYLKQSGVYFLFGKNNEVSKSTFYKIKNGENVTTGVLLRICDVLECDISEIVECVSIEDGGKAGV